jgi:hypothetical protein
MNKKIANNEMERICAPAESFFGFVQSFIGAGSQIRSFLTLED